MLGLALWGWGLDCRWWGHLDARSSTMGMGVETAGGGDT